MTWARAMEAEARISARNAVKIRAALRQSISSTTIYEAYLATQPPRTGNLAQSMGNHKCQSESRGTQDGAATSLGYWISTR